LTAEAIHFLFQNIKFPDIMRGLEEGIVLGMLDQI